MPATQSAVPTSTPASDGTGLEDLGLFSSFDLSIPMNMQPPVSTPTTTSPSFTVTLPATLGGMMPGHPGPPSSCGPTSSGGPSQSQCHETSEWPPQHRPTWQLGPQHPSYVHAAASYLIGVPGGPEWERLLERWVVFESLSSANGVSVFTVAAPFHTNAVIVEFREIANKPPPRRGWLVVPGRTSTLWEEECTGYQVCSDI